jgi:hypothetical protein
MQLSASRQYSACIGSGEIRSINADVVIKLTMNDGFASGGQHGPKEPGQGGHSRQVENPIPKKYTPAIRRDNPSRRPPSEPLCPCHNRLQARFVAKKRLLDGSRMLEFVR